MAETFRSMAVTAGETNAVVYTTPADTTTIIIGAQATNKDDFPRKFTISWNDASAAESYTLADEIVIPADAALAPITGKLVLQDGDALRVRADEAGMVDFTLSVLELS